MYVETFGVRAKDEVQWFPVNSGFLVYIPSCFVLIQGAKGHQGPTGLQGLSGPTVSILWKLCTFTY